ncbi:restriction endonuclease subunit S [Psychrobacter celer]
MSKDTSKPEQLITEHIDIWTNAILAKSTSGRGSSKKYELYGISKLRELILELAVRGKLVPQDANDETAFELLERVSAEKDWLVKEGKIKKQKTLAKIGEDEKLFELPQGWAWVRLGDLLDRISNGYSGKQNKTKNSYPITRIETISKSIIDFEKIGYALEMSEEKLLYYKMQKGDILLSHINSDYHVGKTAIYYDERVLFHGTNLLLLRVNNNIFSDYVNICLNQLRLSGHFIDIAQHAIGQSSVNQKKIKDIVIALPSYPDQIRIVAKVDELMLLCDQLEQQTEASIDAHATLVEVLLATLIDSKDADELAQNWARVSEHFDSLFTTEQSIEALKQTVLQLAVMGKLVPQNPGDEPASVLLEKIAEEKEQLAEQGEIRKSKSLDKVDEEEKLYDLPFNWEWTRLGDIAAVGTGATPSRTESKYWSSQDINWVSSGETSEPFIFNTKEKVSHLAIKETNVSVYPPGTLVVAMYGQGKTRGQITELKIEAGTNQACAAIRLIQPDERHRYYIKLFFWKSYEEIRSNAAGGAQPNLNVSKITSTVIPLPPLAEQHRIVAKVDELMAICDQLKEKLKQSQETQVQLTDALVDRALG